MGGTGEAELARDKQPPLDSQPAVSRTCAETPTKHYDVHLATLNASTEKYSIA